jgi:hypothetical protein
VKGPDTSAVGAACELVTSAARTAQKEDAKTAQVETQAWNKPVGLLGPAVTAFPIRIGMGSALSKTTREQTIRRMSEIPSNYEGTGTLSGFLTLSRKNVGLPLCTCSRRAARSASVL